MESQTIRSQNKNLIINQQRFLQKESNGSIISRNSKERVEKLLKLQLVYHEYLERNEGIFTMKFQLEYISMNQKLKQGVDLNENMKLSHLDYRKRSAQFFQDMEFKRKKTLCIDVMSVFMQKLDIDHEEFVAISSQSVFKVYYVLVKNNGYVHDPNCCRRG